jgi:hypothetical protein
MRVVGIIDSVDTAPAQQLRQFERIQAVAFARVLGNLRGRREQLFRPLPPAALFLPPGSEQLFPPLLRLALQNIDRGASDKPRKEPPDMIHH